VTAVSATDAWAVGSGGNTPLIEHWNGSTWSIVSGPAVAGHLYSITALSASNIWAVGGMGNRARTPLIEHFDGTAWHLVDQPVSTYASFLISVSAAGLSDIWAAGGQTGGTSAPVLLEHFNGTAWTEVPNPALPANLAYNARGDRARARRHLGHRIGHGQLLDHPDAGPALRRQQLAGRSLRQPARRRRPARIRRRHHPGPAPVGDRTRPHHRNHHRLTAPAARGPVRVLRQRPGRGVRRAALDKGEVR